MDAIISALYCCALRRAATSAIMPRPINAGVIGSGTFEVVDTLGRNPI
jgi:hypothetical protein